MGDNFGRRALGFILTIVVSVAITWWAVIQYYKNHDEFEQVIDQPLRSIFLFALILAAIALVVFALIKQTRGLIAAAIVVSFVAGVWGLSVLQGISGWFILWVALAIVVLGLLGYMTLVINTPMWVQNRNVHMPAWLPRIHFGQRGQHAPQSQP